MFTGVVSKDRAVICSHTALDRGSPETEHIHILLQLQQCRRQSQNAVRGVNLIAPIDFCRPVNVTACESRYSMSDIHILWAHEAGDRYHQ